MRVVGIISLVAGIFLSLGTSVALANTTNLSFDPVYGAQPFSFSCSPYKFSFESGKHYVAQNGGPCVYSIPSKIPGTKTIATYKGVPGNSIFVAGDKIQGDSPTLVQEDTNNFGSPAQDQNYFSVVYGYSSSTEAARFDAAFKTGSTTGTLLPSNNYAIIQWKWGGVPASEYEPVVIIPGILGSWQKNGEWVLDPITHIYDNLVDTFLANGYVDGKTLFKFPYDWEEPNEVTASVLAKKIQDIKTICNCSHVNLIGHSMGGLVAAQYIESPGYKNDVDQVFFLATPLSGSPKAYKMWEGGQIDPDSNDIFSKLQNMLLERVFTKEAKQAGYNDTFSYLRNKPVLSIQQLLPTYDYLFDSDFNTITPPKNIFLENIASNFAKITKAARTDTILADTDLSNTISFFITKPSTVLPKWQDGEITATYFDTGDVTVPRVSIENLVGAADKEFHGVNHTEVASTSAAYIFRQLNNKDPQIIVGNVFVPLKDADYSVLINKLSPTPSEFKDLMQTIGSFAENHTILFFLLFSPINMEITAPNGAHIGKDITTGSVVNEIPNALYSGPDAEHEYAIIFDPLPGTYKVQTKGTGNGTYTIATSYIQSTTTNEAYVSGTTTLNQVINNSLYLSSTTTAVTITADASPPPPLTTLTPDTCVTDMTLAYKNKWIGKKAVADNLVFDCKALKELLKTKETIEKVIPAKRTKANALLLTITTAAIKLTLADMDLLAKDKGNMKDGVDLIHKYTTWFRDHQTQ
ncbi:MAG TPA: alpha/beta hydrolase [Candidatus Paceibacterota bacterium]|nr:alpha/beta hydrolase [Candidatus Paceibacterota bacterium]